MLVGTAISWLIGMPAVAAFISPYCKEIHMSKDSNREFYLEGTCHEPDSNDNYLGKIDLGQCIGMNPDTFKLEWKRFGGAGNYCAGCVATKPDKDHSTLTCRCAGSSAGFDPSSPDAVTSSLNLDDGLNYSKEQFWCSKGWKRSSISERRNSALDMTLSSNCGEVRMSEDGGFALEAHCHDPMGNEMFPAKLDLSACIAVDKDGELTWGSGHAENLCADCIAAKHADTDRSYITCRCSLDGDAQSGAGNCTTLWLDYSIIVDDGQLWCDTIPVFDITPEVQTPISTREAAADVSISANPVHRRDTDINPSQTDPIRKGVKYTERCSGFTLAPGETLWTTCSDDKTNKLWWMSIDLNKCIGFSYQTNQLDWTPHGQIDDVCHSCSVSTDGQILQCMCRASQNNEDYVTVLDLNEGITITSHGLACWSLYW